MERKPYLYVWIWIFSNYLFAINYATEIRIDTKPADIELSGAAVFINQKHTVRFTIHAVSEDGDLAENLATPHFEVRAAYCSSGTGGGTPEPDDCNLVTKTITPDDAMTTRQKYELAKPYAVSGSAELEVTDASTCQLIQHVCVIIFGTQTGVLENDISCIPTDTVCTDDWVDIIASDLRLEIPEVNSDSYTDIRARASIIITNNGILGEYKVTMYLSKDDYIDTKTDKQITTLPPSFNLLSNLPESSSVIDISGAGLKIPDVHTNFSDQKYCGPVFLGLMLDGTSPNDPVRDRGNITEPDEWNNFDVYPIVILCPTDSLSLSDFSFYLGYQQDMIVATFAMPILINVTVNIHRYDHAPIYPMLSNFELELYLHDQSSTFINQALGEVNSTAIKVSLPGVEYTREINSRVGRATGESVQLDNIQIWVEVPNIFPDIDLKLFIFVKEPSNSQIEEAVLANNFIGKSVPVKKELSSYDDAHWVKLDDMTWPDALKQNDTLTTATFKGYVSNQYLGEAKLYWSVDDKFDGSDIDSGLVFEVTPQSEEHRVELKDPPDLFSAPLLEPQFCGIIFGIWVNKPTAASVQIDPLAFNDVYVRRIIIRCNDTDTYALTVLQVLNPPVMWEGVMTDFTFSVTISCVSLFCNGATANHDFAVSIDGGTPVAITQQNHAYDNYDKRTFIATYSAQLMGATNRFVAEITPVDGFTENNRLVFDIPPIVPEPYDRMDIYRVSVSITDTTIELDQEIPFSIIASFDFSTPLSASEWPHFLLDLYISMDTEFSSDDFRIPYRMTDALRDSLSESLTSSYAFKDHVGFRLPRKGLERFCPSKTVYICAFMDSYDPDETDDTVGQIKEIKEYNNFGCLATAKPLDTGDSINCSTTQADPEEKLAVSIIGQVSMLSEAILVNALFENVVMTLNFDVGITNHHSQKLNGNGTLPGNWDLELKLQGPLLLTITSDLTPFKEHTIGPGETLKFSVEAQTANTDDFCTEYSPAGIPLILSLDLTGGEDTANYPTPIVFIKDLPIACDNTFGPSFAIDRGFTISEDGSSLISSYEIPITVTLTNYYKGSPGTNLITGAHSSPYYTITADLTPVGSACSPLTLSPITFEEASTDELEIVAGGERTFGIRAQLDVDNTTCLCMAGATQNKLKLIISPETIASGYIASQYEANLPATITFNCGNASLVDLILDTSATVIQQDQSLSPSLSYGAVSVTVSPDNTYKLQFIFSTDDAVDNEDQILAEFTRTLTDNFDHSNDQVPLNSYMAARFCNVNDLYLIIHVELDSGASGPDRNILDNTRYIKIDFSCPGDMYRLESVQGLDTSLVGGAPPGVDNKLQFTATVANVRSDTMEIPTGRRHSPNFIFELLHKDNTDAGFWWSWMDLHVLQGQEVMLSDATIGNGERLEFILEAAETITSTQCTNVITPTGKLRVQMYQGIGLGADSRDTVPQDDYIEIDASCASSYHDLAVLSMTVSPAGTFNLTLTSSPPGPTDPVLQEIYISRDDGIDQDIDVLVKSSSITMPGDLTQTSVSLSEFDGKLKFMFCGHVHFIVMIKPDSALNDPDQSNNIKAFAHEIDCADSLTHVKDVYDIKDVTIDAQSTFISDRQALIRFDAKVKNMGTTAIPAGLDILQFKIYAKRGVHFLMDEMIDVTPELTYFENEQDKLYATHAVDAYKTFIKIEGNVTLPRTLCEMGVDHLFIGVEKPDDIKDENVLQNNFEAYPITCMVTDSSIDLYPRPDQAGGHRFRFTHKHELVIGEQQEFILEVNSFVTGAGGSAWEPLPDDGLPVFGYEFILSPPGSSELEPQRVPHTVNITEINKPLMANESTVFILGGHLNFPLSSFMDFCGLGNLTLQVKIDPNDDVMEADELNNEAYIRGLRLTEDGATCDSPLSTWAISDFQLLPASRAYAIFNTPSNHRLHFEFTLIYRNRGSNPSPNSVEIELFLRKEMDESGSARDRKTLNGLTSWEERNTGTGDVTKHTTIVIGPAEANAGNYSIDSSMSDQDLSIYCGRLPYLGILVDPDGDKPEGYQHARIAWTRIRLECPAENGFALVDLMADPQILGPTLSDFSATVMVSNKGTQVLPTDNVELQFQVYLRTETEDVLLSSSQTVQSTAPDPWTKGVTRTYPIATHPLIILDNCEGYEDMKEICLRVHQTPTSLPDSNQLDNIVCTPLVEGYLDIDCARDIGLNNFILSLLPNTIITKEVQIDFDFNVTLEHVGRAIPATANEEGHFNFEFFIRSDATCTPETDAKISSSESTVLINKITSKIENATSHTVRGKTSVTIPAAECLEGQEYFICVSYTMMTELNPAFRDAHNPNDCTCVNMTAHFNCSNMDEIRPQYFKLLNKLVELNERLAFDLEVQIEKTDPNITAPFIFTGKFFLSADDQLDTSDIGLEYNYFEYGDSYEEMTRPLQPGNHTMNLGGERLVIHDFLIISPNLCGQIFLLYKADPDNEIIEKNEHDNVLGTPIIINCDGNIPGLRTLVDQLHLTEFQFHIEEPLFSGRDSVIYIDYVVFNVGPDIPLPSPSSPLYDIEITSNANPANPILTTAMLQMPDVYSLPMARGARHVFQGIPGDILGSVWSKTLCENTYTLKCCLKRSTDTVPNNCLTRPLENAMKMCELPKYDRDIVLQEFFAPTYFGMQSAITVQMAMSVILAQEAIPIRPRDFRSALYLTHSPDVVPHMTYYVNRLEEPVPVLEGHLMAELINDFDMLPGESMWKTEMFKGVILNPFPPDNTYCGIQYMHLVADSGRDIMESSEKNNIRTKQVIIKCFEDVWSVGPLELSTSEGILIENTSIPFIMKLPISCVHPVCDIAAATENVKLNVSYGKVNESLPIVAGFIIDHVYDGVIEPGLGVSFPAPSVVRWLTVRSVIDLPDGLCDEGTVEIIVEVLPGMDAPLMMETHLENNKYKILYPCSEGLKGDDSLRDIIAYPIAILGGKRLPRDISGQAMQTPVLTAGVRTVFKLKMEFRGPQIPPQDGAPHSAPLTYALFISDDDTLDDHDIKLPHVMADSVAGALSNLPDKPIHIAEFLDITNSFVVPPGLSGLYHILVQLDDTDRIAETTESNNIASTAVYIHIPDDVFAMTGLFLDMTAPIWPNIDYNCTAVVNITNVALFDIMSGDKPFGYLNAYLSEDTVLDDWEDKSINVDYAMADLENRLKVSIHPGMEITVPLLLWNISMTSAECQRFKHIIINILPQRNYKETDTDRSDNYMSFPMRKVCSGSADIIASSLSAAGHLNGTTTWDVMSSRPTNYAYRFWASHNDIIEPDIDSNLNIEGIHMVGSIPGVPETVISNVNFADLPKEFCGKGYLIAELDVFDEIVEEDENNNQIAAEFHKYCPGDAMTFNVLSLNANGKMDCGQPFSLTFGFYVNCFSNDTNICTNVQATSNNFYFTLKLLDGNLQHVSNVIPSRLDENTLQDPSVVKQQLFENPLEFEVTEDFTLVNRTQCEDIRYMEVEIHTGTSPVMEIVNIGPRESKIRKVPITFMGEPKTIDLVATSVTVSAAEGFKVNVSSKMFDLSLVVTINADNWDVEYPNNEAFTYILGVESSSHPEWNIGDIGYVPSPTVLSSLTGRLASRVINLSEKTSKINWDLLRTFCGHEDLKLTVSLDPDNRLMEEDEANNFLLSSDSFSVIGCQDGFDLKISNFNLSKNDLEAGGTVGVDVDVRFVIVGTDLGLFKRPRGKWNYIITFDLVNSVEDPNEVHPIDFDMTNLDELSAKIWTSNTDANHGGVSDVIEHYLNDLMPVTIPPDDILCGKSWFLRAGVVLEEQTVGMAEIGPSQDLAPRDNYAYEEVRIRCIADQLSLWDVTVVGMPEEFWSDAVHDIKYKITVRNKGESIPPSVGTGHLFRVKQYVSAFAEWVPAQVTGGSYALVDQGKAEYRHNSGAAEDSLIMSPTLTGTISIPKSMCVQAVAASGNPTIFIQMSPAENRYSPDPTNDILKIRMNKSRISCREASVDLMVSSVLVSGGTGVIKANTPTQKLFYMRHIRTSLGSIPASTSKDLSYNYSLYLSKTAVWDDGARFLPIEYTEEEINKMKRGIGPTTPESIAFPGENLLVNITADPLSSHYCGQSFLFVKVKDLKNTQNIDPRLGNNYNVTPIELQCDGDLLYLNDISVTLTGGQHQFYPGVWTEMRFKGKITYHIEQLQPGISAIKKPLFRFFLSKDPLLEIFIDPELKAVADISQIDVQTKPGSESRTYEGLLHILAQQSACKFRPSYLLVFVMFGGGYNQNDPIVLNNYQAIPLNGLFNCSLDTADLYILNFEMISGYVLTPGMHTEFNVTVRTDLTRGAFLGSYLPDSMGLPPRMFEIAFYLSLDTLPDESDFILNYNYAEFDSFLRILNTYNSFIIPLVSNYSRLIIPEDLELRFCGNVYILVMVDPENNVWEIDEKNNVAYVPVDLRCPYDVISMTEVRIDLQPVYFRRPGGLRLNMLLTAFGGENFIYDGDAMMIRICIRANSESVCHDVTPSYDWVKMPEESVVSFSDPLSPGENATHSQIRNFVDISKACSMAQDPIRTGMNELVIEMVVGDPVRKPGIFDGIRSNNIHMEPINVDCSQYFLDISVGKFDLSTKAGHSTNMLQLGANYFSLAVIVNTSNPAVYNSLISGVKVFDYSLTLSVTRERVLGFEDDGTPKTELQLIRYQIPYETSKRPINRQVATNDVLDLTDLSRGYSLEGLFWMCLAKELIMTVAIDSEHQRNETNEENNSKTLANLKLPPCEDGQDLEVKVWGINGLTFDTLHAEEEVSFTLKVETLLVGNKSSINGLPDFIKKHHFELWFFLSLDKKPYLNSSDVVIGLTLSDEQIKALKKNYLNLDLMDLDGVMKIPVNSTTYPLCWKKVNVGVLIDPKNGFEEVDKTNNIAYYEVLFDCGNALDECRMGLDNCHENATCLDRPYSMFDYHRGQLINGTGEGDRPFFLCTCKEGFTGDGVECTNLDECTEVDHYGHPLHDCHKMNNTKCVDLEGGYDCVCDDGYKIKTDFTTGDKTCKDIDECKLGLATDCHEEALCNNIEGSHICTCKPGFRGNGTFCEDINECENDPCQNGATCHNEENYARCECGTFYEGEFCEIVNGNWGSWGAWSVCDPPCGSQSMSERLRSCDNPAPKRGQLCSVATGAGGKEIMNCNKPECGFQHIETCEQSRCISNGNCGVLHRTQICDPGYERKTNGDGSVICADINECDMHDGLLRHTCDPVLGICTNVAGSFKCSCFKGYEMKNETGNKCHDIRECSKGSHRCDENAICYELAGGYECTCNTGYKMKKLGHHQTGVCIEERLLPYGEASGDILLETESTLSPGEKTSQLIFIPRGLPLFDGNLAESVYITENGAIIATNEVIDSTQKNPYQHAEYLRNIELKESQAAGIIAPFWTDAKYGMESKVWYNVYYEREHIHDEIEKLALKSEECPSMDLDFVLKVTWYKMEPTYLSDSEHNTFQAIVFTNNKQTCVMFIYDKEGMKWTSHESTNHPMVEIGYFTPAQHRSLLYDNYTEATFEDIFRIGQSPNDTGIRQLRLDENPTGYGNPKKECIEWNSRQPRVESWLTDLAGNCPRFLGQAQKDMRFKEETVLNIQCFKGRFPLDNGANVQCCYEAHSGALSSPARFAPMKDRYFRHGFVILSPDDAHAFDWCCLRAPDGHFDYCKKFIEKRPLASSDNYDELATAVIDSMGIYSTFDGHINILPTFGEYLASRSACLLVQTRHSLDQKKNDNIHVRGVAIKVGCVSDSKVEIYSTNTSLELMVDGISWTSGMELDGFSIEAKDDCGDAGFMIVYKNGIVLQVTNKKLRLRVVLMVPKSMLEENEFEGLLGNGDGEPSNDDEPFTPKDDEQAVGKDILSWENIQVAGVSIYGTNTNDWSLFSKYIEEYLTADTPITSALEYYKRGQVLPNLSPDDKDLYASRASCTFEDATDPYVPCLLDVLYTGSQDLGGDTLANRRCFLDLHSNLSYVPPSFVDSERKLVLNRRSAELELPLYEMDLVYSIKARHPEDRPLTFTPSLRDSRHSEILDSREQTRNVETVPTGEVGVYKSTFTYKLNITYDPFYLSMTVSDGKAAAVWQPHVILCLCQHGGECVEDVAEIKDDFGLWSNARCTCLQGWTGEECETELDGCHIEPCKTECIDHPAPGRYDVDFQEFSCKPCPEEQGGDGRSCYAHNECLLEEDHPLHHKCDHFCTDTLNKYVCSCKPGFILRNGTKCEDRKECASANLNDCDETHGICVDEPEGSYTCGCLAGYHLQPDNTCVDIDECIGEAYTCQQICINTDGSYECSCLHGFTKYLKDKCIDIDECKEGNHGCDGVCVNTNGGYECECPIDGFSLDESLCRCKPHPDKTCSMQENLCLHPDAFCSKIDGIITCHCPKGFYLGVDERSCVDLNECTTNRHQCGPLADCVNRNGTYDCVCKEGFTPDSGTGVCKDIDECIAGSDNCQQRCVNVEGSFNCACHNGFVLNLDGITCNDTDECAPGQTNDCAREAICESLSDGRYKCTCSPGFTGNGIECYDLRYCDTNNGGCQMKCRDTKGSHVCSCDEGFTPDPGDPTKCVDIDECSVPEAARSCSRMCHNRGTPHPKKDGHYTCSCEYGFELKDDGRTCQAVIDACEHVCGGGTCVRKDGFQTCFCYKGYHQSSLISPVPPSTECTNIDECSTEENQCNATMKAQCVDMIPGYRCQCEQGYKLNPDRITCRDIDECMDGTHTCNLISSECQNTNGSYECNCKSGFKQNRKDRNKCDDINECRKRRLQENRCDIYTKADCINKDGTYACQCKLGYYGNGTHCYDVDECRDHSTCDKEKEVCVNEQGGYHCECRQGYQNESGVCTNIDECLSPTLNKCGSMAMCEDTLGSYICQCDEDEIPSDDGHTCIRRDPCSENQRAMCGDAKCKKVKKYKENGRLTNEFLVVCECEYPREFKEGQGCVDINECEVKNPCKKNSNCANKDPLFECVCSEGYIPSPDRRTCEETDGGFGQLSKPSECSQDCNGITKQTRICNNPPPVGRGRKCKGKAEVRKLCSKKERKDCKAKRPHQGSFMDIQGMEPEEFEDFEGAIIQSEVDTLNEYLRDKKITEDKYCKKNKHYVKGQILILSKTDFVSSGGYPRALSSNTRFLRHVTIGKCRSRKKRSLPEVIIPQPSYNSQEDFARQILTDEDDTDFLPNSVYIEAMNAIGANNQSVFMDIFNENLYDARKMEYTGKFNFSFSPGYNEDLEETTAQVFVTATPEVLPAWGIAIIAVVGCIIIIIIITLISIKIVNNKDKKDDQRSSRGKVSPEPDVEDNSTEKWKESQEA